MKTRSPKARTSGFTLIELMVSMGITAVIITVLVTITSVATETWTRGRSQLRASRQAKVLIDTMAKDFESLVSRRGDNAEWLNAVIDSGANLPSVIRSGGGQSDVASLTFFTAATDRYNGQIGETEDRGGDVSCVAYRIRFNDPIGTGGGGSNDNSTFVVYRDLINPDETFNNLLGEEDLEASFSSYENGVTDDENFVCENAHEVVVTFLVEVVRAASGGGNRPETARLSLSSSDSSGEFRLVNGGIETQGIELGDFTEDEIAGGRLTGVELSVSVLSDAGMIRRNAANGLTEEDYSRQSYHYSRVVDVPGG